MNEIEKALSLIKEYGPQALEAAGIIASLATALKVIETSMSGKEIDEELKAKVDVAYTKAFQRLMDTA